VQYFHPALPYFLPLFFAHFGIFRRDPNLKDRTTRLRDIPLRELPKLSRERNRRKGRR
jgi:hypothetical protein